MEWVKLHGRYYGDPKVMALPDADTEVLFVRSLAYAGDQETGGFIPEHAVRALTRVRRSGVLVRALVKTGLWTAVSGGWQITRWDVWQADHDVLAKRRHVDRERQRRKRAAERSNMSRDTSSDSHVTVRHREKEKELPPVAPHGGRSVGYETDPDFVRFWEIYPRKVAKPAAFKAWRTQVSRGVDPTLIQLAARRYAEDRRGQDPKFTAHPATWLNGERFNDQPVNGSGGGWWDN